MRGVALFRPPRCLALFSPPYEAFASIDTSWRPRELPPRGIVVVWWLVDAREQEHEFRWVYDRAPGLPLVIVLPPATELSRISPVLPYLPALEPRAVLPSGRITDPFRLHEVLAAPPQRLAANLTAYLVRRRVLVDEESRREVQRAFELASELTSISELARRLYVSRRTLGRHFAAAGLPVPSHWLQFGRLMNAAVLLQVESTAVFRIAAQTGYPDGFTLSNQMRRLLGCRPSDIRRTLGWEWLVELWLRQETRRGGFDPDRFRQAIGMYIAPSDRFDERAEAARAVEGVGSSEDGSLLREGKRPYKAKGKGPRTQDDTQTSEEDSTGSGK